MLDFAFISNSPMFKSFWVLLNANSNLQDEETDESSFKI